MYKSHILYLVISLKITTQSGQEFSLKTANLKGQPIVGSYCRSRIIALWRVVVG